MRKFTNPLDNIRVASPCSANWDEMFGNARKRYCGDCKLNVYNLSDMSRHDAETLLANSEGRLCVRFFRRADGTILTKNCPVGWQAVKARASRVATAVFSMLAGVVVGVMGVPRSQATMDVTATVGDIDTGYIQGGISNAYTLPDHDGEMMGKIVGPEVEPRGETVGRVRVTR